MAEWFVGPVMEKIIDTCFEHLKDHLGRKTSVEEQLKKLRVIHPRIQAVVSAYSQAQIEDPALNDWYWQLRDAVDEADDVLDELEYNRKREKQASTNSRKRKADLLERALEIGKSAVKGDPNLKRLEEAVQKLYEISTEVSTFLHLVENTKQKQQQEMRETRETGSIPKDNLVGRSEEMEFVRRWLRNPNQTPISNTDFYSKISLLSVVGLGGMGKTTLLQHIYEDGVTEEFDVKMWACVSTDFKAKTVIANILNSVVQINLQPLKKQAYDGNSLEELQTSLKSEVMSKRFLLVLDDIWEADETKWKNVLAPLHYGSLGSKILITTRMDSVASQIAKMIKKSKEILPLKGLEEDECYKLFNIHAFGGVENPDDGFRNIAKKMVEKLSGCPLAAKVIGGILNSYVDKSYWTKVLNTNIGNLESSENDLLPILKLSYIYLPNHLQNCFAFCSMFRQDHEFDKDDLVRMWIALGFIQTSNISGETLEETGRRYFNILVQKSFFEEFHTCENEVCYKMHDLLHELAQSVSTKECFKAFGYKKFSTAPETIRHLSIDTGFGDLEVLFQKMRKFKNLRSLFLSLYNDDRFYDHDFDGFYENVISENLKASKTIRLLVLYSPFIDHYPEKIYEMIGCLIHLRYLKVEGFYYYLKLPRSISHLYHLQFIISKNRLYLEMDEIGLKELMPNENCQLIINELVIKDPSVLLMETLSRICSSFSSLTIEENDELVSFPGEAEQWILQHSSSLFKLLFMTLKSLQSLPSSLESLSSLEYLHVYNVPQLKLLPNPPASLQDLRLVNLESLQCLPSSLSTISSLTHLILANIPLLKSLSDLPSSLKELEIEELESLQGLPCLPTSLNMLRINKVPRLLELPDLPASLKELNLTEFESLLCQPSCLPTTLLTLTITKVPGHLELPDLPPSLRLLNLKELESLQCLPSSLSSISSLTHLILTNIPLFKSFPELPSSLQHLYLKELESLQGLPSCLPTTLKSLCINKVPWLMELPDLPASLQVLWIRKVPRLLELPDLPASLEDLWIDRVPRLLELPDLPATLDELNLDELESLQCLPSRLPTRLKKLWIKKVPRLLELPGLPAFLQRLYIEDCDPHLMERYPNLGKRLSKRKYENTISYRNGNFVDATVFYQKHRREQ